VYDPVDVNLIFCNREQMKLDEAADEIQRKEHYEKNARELFGPLPQFIKLIHVDPPVIG
jgi:hypothetical protein